MGALKLEDINYTYDDYKVWKGNWELIQGIPFCYESRADAKAPKFSL